MGLSFVFVFQPLQVNQLIERLMDSYALLSTPTIVPSMDISLGQAILGSCKL